MQRANTRLLALSSALILGVLGALLLGHNRLPLGTKPTPVFHAPREQSFDRPELDAVRELIAQCEASLAHAEETPWLSLLQVRALGPRSAPSDLAKLSHFLTTPPATPAPAPFTADAQAGIRLTLAEARKPVTATNAGAPGLVPHVNSALDYAARLSVSAALDEALKHAQPAANGAAPAEVPELLRIDVIAHNLEGALSSLERLTLDTPEPNSEAAIQAAFLVAQVVFHSLSRLEIKGKQDLDARARRSYLKLRNLDERDNLSTGATQSSIEQLQRSALLAELSAVVALTNPTNPDAASRHILTIDTRQLLTQLGAQALCEAQPKAEVRIAALSSALRALRAATFALQLSLTAAP